MDIPAQVVVTGPEHSLTGVVARIVATGLDGVLHRALPHVDRHGTEFWWTGTDYPDALFIVVHRDRVYRNLASVARGQAAHDAQGRYDRAMNAAALLSPALWVNATALMAEPVAQVVNLGLWLGATLWLPEDVYDADEKWVNLIGQG